ncbi:hypothetical protein TNCV_4175251 [Trichonephila clavipes]|nr:hypothetical protein TNCV_4175251 [Trichonephila clavipes]
MGLHYSTQDKVDLFADSLESSFQENPEPYDDDFIDHVKERVDNFLHRSTDLTTRNNGHYSPAQQQESTRQRRN